MTIEEIKQGLLEKISSIENSIRELVDQRNQLFTAHAALQGQTVETTSTPIDEIPVKKTPPKATMPKKAKPARKYTRSRRGGPVKRKSSLGWKPGPGASPWTPHIYDMLEDGRSMTSGEVRAALLSEFPQVTQLQVASVLSSMRQSNRLTVNEQGQWRRKYSRHNVEPVAPEPQPESNGGVFRLKELAQAGKVKEVRPDVYELGQIAKPAGQGN
jgi:hypothetical protein